MISTYTVVIQNAKSMESFLRFQPLFADAIHTNKIGICKWNEAGTTIDTAVPELRSLTDDKEEWRAIIVRFIDDNCMAAFESDIENPYDFEINKGTEDAVQENEVPLVRLTQMLGGIPPLEVHFQPEIIREKHKAPRTVYKPIENPLRENKYKHLCEKYSFNGVRPSAITIVTIRLKDKLEDNGISQVWENHRESDSSEFWKRNHYPSICRFIVYDYSEKGPVQKKADDFNFWISVFLLATNEIDSSVLQAYRLYTVKTHINKDEMTESFQVLTDRLLAAKQTIEKAIKRDIENQICEEEPLPDYKLNVTASFKLPDITDRAVNTTSFPLLSNDTNGEVSLWEKKVETIEHNYGKAVISSERTLDQVADRMRVSYQMDEAETPALNRYQKEDLSHELNGLYAKIVNIQSDLPTGTVTSKTSAAIKKVKDALVQRVLKKPAFATLFLTILLILLAMIPSIVFVLQRNGDNYFALGCAFGAQIIVVGLFVLIYLVIQKNKLNRLVQDYNIKMGNQFDKLIDNSDQYSEYMSSIASHARGSLCLSMSSQKEEQEDETRLLKVRHISAINSILGKIKEWSKAYHLSVLFKDRILEERVDVDTSINPGSTRLYALETGLTQKVSVNQSGLTIDSPFSFTDRIDIVREELYDECK